MEILKSTGASTPLECAHCRTLVSPQHNWPNREGLPFCCAGCRAVHSVIQSCQLTEYYNIRDAALQSVEPVRVETQTFDYLDEPEIRSEFEGPPGVLYFFITGIQCAACIWILEKIPDFGSGIESVRIDGARKLAAVRVAPGGRFALFAEWAQKFGYDVKPIKLDESLRDLQAEARREDLKRIAIAAVCAGNIMLLSSSVYLGADPELTQAFHWVSLALTVPVFLFSARPLFLSTWASFKTRVPSMDLPLAVALTAGLVVSVVHLLQGRDRVYFDGLSVLVFLILVSRYFVSRIQDRYLEKAGNANALLPSYARIWHSPDQQELVPLKALRRDTVVEVREGEVLPCDGFVVDHEAWVEESILTGESAPVRHVKGSEVSAGTRVQSGALLVKVTALDRETRVGKIQQEVQRAAFLKSQGARKFDSWAQKFTYAVLLGALVIWLLSMNTGEGWARALSFLIVACPCALAFGAPMVLSNALSQAAKRGLYIRTADVFEKLLEVKTVVFDKTGTLTLGRLALVSQSHPITLEHQKALVALETQSAHPVAKAIVRELGGGLAELPGVSEVTHLRTGVRGLVDGQMFEVRASSRVSDDAAILNWVDFFKGDQLLTRFCFRDRLRDEAPLVVKNIVNRNLTPVLLSGDKKGVAHRVAREAGLQGFRVIGEASPEEKLELVAQMDHALMVGDGVNDAAAMARAHLGVAVGGGLVQTMQAADVLLASGGIRGLLDLFSLAESAWRGQTRVLWFSLVYNLSAGLIAALGWLHPLVAAILMPVSSVCVLGLVFLSMRRVRWA